ncbi:hypothetical protein SLEP1_g22292 [Rubroshorea leprosula]|uniref:Uncharacterized protein n=1 Tax=Rubroshorea leprosula TaxID=152421 RepID=A0AAV5J8R6_9ROSI|nr:hypothetical protein SLEP1_g22292 [Rubroshorea leprosula]
MNMATAKVLAKSKDRRLAMLRLKVKEKVWPNHSRVKQQSKSDAHKSGASLGSKQIKVKASMPHEAKMPKENEEKTSIPQPLTKGKGGHIFIPDNDEVSSKAKEAKNVEALMKNMDEASAKDMEKALTKNMDEALVRLEACCKIIADEADEPSPLGSIIGLIDDIFDWNDFASFAAQDFCLLYGYQPVETATKSKPKESPYFKADDIFLALKKSSIEENVEIEIVEEKEIQVAANKDKGKKVVKEPNPKSNEDSDMKSTKSDEVSRDNPLLEKGMPYLAVAPEESIPSKDEINVDEPTICIAKKAVSFGKIISENKCFLVPAKLSNRENMRNKAKKVLIENAFINLCATMRHMEVTPFAEMDEEFFHLCNDAIDEAKNINFEVEATWVGEGKPW